MDLIAKVRELGAAIQEDERYLNFRKAQQASEADTALNELIAKFQLAQASFQYEAGKEDKDDAKLQQLDTELGQLYGQIMASPTMGEYEAAANEIDAMMKYINGILTLCIQGEDPATCEPPKEEEHHCGGECSSCGGCH